MRGTLRDERGSALIAAILLVGVMSTIGLATFAMADTQHAESGFERKRESSFNLGEAAASAQVFQLSRGWPGSAGAAYPTSCTPTSTNVHCPDPTNLESSFDSVDYGDDTTWTTTVRDNGGQAGSFYSDAVAAGQPSYDASGPNGVPDGRVWVRAEATVRGKTRKIVTLVQAGEVARPFPQNALTAGWLSITPNAPSKVMIDTNGNPDRGQPADVWVRCTEPAPSPACLKYQPSSYQISPETAKTGWPTESAMGADALEEMRVLAQARGTYYATGCPTTLTGRLIFIENANCSYNSRGSYNTPEQPGMVVVGSGTLTLSGNRKFYGLLYGANLQRTTGAVVTVQGTAEIHGAVAVDAQGGVVLGSSGVTLFHDASVFNLPLGLGNASAVQGSWRELY